MTTPHEAIRELWSAIDQLKIAACTGSETVFEYYFMQMQKAAANARPALEALLAENEAQAARIAELEGALTPDNVIIKREYLQELVEDIEFMHECSIEDVWNNWKECTTAIRQALAGKGE